MLLWWTFGVILLHYTLISVHNLHVKDLIRLKELIWSHPQCMERTVIFGFALGPHSHMLFPIPSRSSLFLLRAPPCLRSYVFLHSFVCLPCSYSTTFISLHHVFCVFSYVFHPYASTSICPEAVSSMVWRRNATGMGAWVGWHHNPGSENCFAPILFVFIAFQL